MAVFSEGVRPGHFLHTDLPGTISRDTATVTVPANTTLVDGQVLGRVTTGGKYVAVANGPTPASNGSQNAAGILYGNLVNDTASPVDMRGVVVNRDAEVVEMALTWGSSDETAGKAQLFALGIKMRDDVSLTTL